jgi:formate hydrogenlyase subunit 6/NADH:ubiquinone oxidoreductase subunit I
VKIPYIKEAVGSLFKNPVTVKYPFIKIQTPEGFRGKIEFDETKCIGCGLCIKVCAPAAITKTVTVTDEGQKTAMEFNMGSCTFCSFCADFCPKGAIHLSNEYSMIKTADENNLLVHGSFIKKLPQKPNPAAVTGNNGEKKE